MDCFKKLKCCISQNTEDSREMENLNTQPGTSTEPIANDGSTSITISEEESARNVWRGKMFQYIKRKNPTPKDLTRSFNILDSNMKRKNKNDLFEPESEEPHYTMLQYACNLDNEELATKYVKRIFAIAKNSLDYDDQDFHKFVNHPVGGGMTALHMAISKGYKDVVLELLKKAADVNLRAPGQAHNAIYYIYVKFPQVMQNLFDEGIAIEEGHTDTTVKCDFSSITGIKIKDEPEKKYNEFRETSLLASVIGNSKVQRSEILLHPLVQIFLKAKGNYCFTIFIWISVFYQIGWSLMSVIFLAYKSQLLQNIPKNISENSTTTESSPFPEPDDIHIYIFWGCYGISLVIELIEAFKSPIKYIYWGQVINYFQIALLIIIPLSETCITPRFINAVGIFAALLLVQGQTTKFSWVGIYNEMLFQIICHFFKFFIAFCPMLLAFMLTFHFLLYPREQFALEWGMGFAKIFAMLTGELEHNGIFFPEKEAEKPVDPFLTIVVFLIFVIAVVILLQNLLVGLTVQDVQILKEKCLTDHLTTRLEAICLIEHLLTCSCLLTISKLKNYILGCILVGRALKKINPQKDEKFTYTTKLSKLPKTVRNAIKEKYMPETDPNILKIIDLALTKFHSKTKSDRKTDK